MSNVNSNNNDNSKCNNDNSGNDTVEVVASCNNCSVLEPVVRDDDSNEPLTREAVKKNPDLLIPMYQQGNFGVKLGRIRHEMVLKTSKMLIISGGVYIILLIVATATFHAQGLTLIYINPTWIIPVMVIAGGVTCMWYAKTLHKLVKPLSLLMLIRYMMIFTYILELLAFFLHIVVIAQAFGVANPNWGFLKVFSGLIAVSLTVLDVVLFWMTIGSINKKSENYLDKCCCCMGFETGTELAPDVPDPLFVNKMIAVAKVTKAVGGALD